MILLIWDFVATHRKLMALKRLLIKYLVLSICFKCFALLILHNYKKTMIQFKGLFMKLIILLIKKYSSHKKII